MMPGEMQSGRRETSQQFHGTIEFIPGQRAAIVSLLDGLGEWSGAERIELRPLAFETRDELHARLYEVGYTCASRKATHKGGRLETYRAV
jgi:hypothetical protein